MGRSSHLLEEREHAKRDHVLPEVVAHLEDESRGRLLQCRLIHICHLQPLWLLKWGQGEGGVGC